MSDVAGVGPGTRGLDPDYEAVATLHPGEVDTLAPPDGVTSLSEVADMSARWEEGMARPAVVHCMHRAGLDTETRGESAALTASGQQAVM